MTSSHPRGARRSRLCGGTRPNPLLPDLPVLPLRPDGPSAWVRVTCPACGVVRVRSDRVVIRNCVDDETWSYRARCSGCDTVFVGATPAALALPAVAAGLMVELWTLPRPSHRHAGSPLHAVDALELHLALLESDWFDELARVDPLDDR